MTPFLSYVVMLKKTTRFTTVKIILQNTESCQPHMLVLTNNALHPRWSIVDFNSAVGTNLQPLVA